MSDQTDMFIEKSTIAEKDHTFKIDHHAHGLAIHGERLPADIFERLPARKYPVFAADIARKLGALLVMTTEGGAEKWLKELEEKS